MKKASAPIVPVLHGRPAGRKSGVNTRQRIPYRLPGRYPRNGSTTDNTDNTDTSSRREGTPIGERFLLLLSVSSVLSVVGPLFLQRVEVALMRSSLAMLAGLLLLWPASCLAASEPEQTPIFVSGE